MKTKSVSPFLFVESGGSQGDVQHVCDSVKTALGGQKRTCGVLGGEGRAKKILQLGDIKSDSSDDDAGLTAPKGGGAVSIVTSAATPVLNRRIKQKPTCSVATDVKTSRTIPKSSPSLKQLNDDAESDLEHEGDAGLPAGTC